MIAFLGVIPGLSVASVALLSIFTVGYFSKIGLHFIGLVDVSNLVYSFGLSFSIVALVAFVVNGDTARLIRAAAEEEHFLPFLVKLSFVMVPALIVAQILHGLPQMTYLPSFFASEGFIFTALFIFTMWLLVVVYTRHIAEERIIGTEVAGLVIAIIFTMAQAGRYQATKEIFSTDNFYEVQLKDSAQTKRIGGSMSILKGVHIIRSSSNGFIISIEGIVSFLPRDEVWMVTASKAVEP